MNVHKMIKTIRKKIKKLRSAKAVFEMPCAEAHRIKPATRSSVFWGVRPGGSAFFEITDMPMSKRYTTRRVYVSS